MGISFGKQKESKSRASSEYAPSMWLPGQGPVAGSLKRAFVPAVFGGQFGASPMVRTIAELARSGASKEVGATLNELSEMKGLSQPALAKVASQLPSKMMEASAAVYQELYKAMLGLATQYGLMPAGTKGKSTSTGSGGGGFSMNIGLGEAGSGAVTKALGV